MDLTRKPSKKRKSGDYIPDGFVAETPRKPPGPPLKVPKFENAFAFDKPPNRPPKAGPSTKPKSSSTLAKPVPAFPESGSKPSSSMPQTPKPMRPLQPLGFVIDESESRRSTTPNPSSKGKAITPRPPPVSPFVGNTASSSREFNPLPLAFSIPQSPKLPTKLLKVPQPPPIFQPQRMKEPRTDLKEITRTRLAQTMDISTRSGAAELMSLMLQQEPLPLPDPPEGRGLEFSPEKKGKGNKLKIAPGGLADRAGALFANWDKQLVMWQRESEGGHYARLGVHFRALILTILQPPAPLVGCGTPQPYTPGLALCRVYPSDKVPLSRRKNYRIFFSFAPSGIGQPHLDPSKFVEGATARIFHPWSEVSPRSDDAMDTDATPSSLPMPCAEPEDPLELPTSDNLILCTRFILG